MNHCLKWLILICVSFSSYILDRVYSSHIRNQSNFKHTPLYHYGLLSRILNNKTNWYSLNQDSNVLYQYKIPNVSNLSNTLGFNDYNSLNLNNRINKQCFNFIINNINHGLSLKHRSRIKPCFRRKDDYTECNPADLEGGNPDIIREYNSYLWPKPIYENEVDRFINFSNKVDKLYDKYKDWDTVYEKMNVKPPNKISNDDVAHYARHLFDLPLRPSNYLCKIFYELGIIPLYDDLNKLIKRFRDKIESKLFLDKDLFPRNPKFAFGIEPLDDFQPITDHSFRGYLAETYDHIRNMAVNNPKRAQKILTVLHRIYKPITLICDEEGDVNDHEVLKDMDYLNKITRDCEREFMKKYPDLKFPANDYDYLELYRNWYDGSYSEKLPLSSTIKESHLDNYGPKTISYDRYLVKPFLGMIAGAALGKGSELLIDYLYETSPEIFDSVHENKKTLKYILASLSFLALNDSNERPDFFHEILKFFYPDVKMLENGDLRSLLNHTSNYSSKTKLNNLFGIFDLVDRLFKKEGEDLMGTRYSNATGKADGSEHVDTDPAHLIDMYDSQLLKGIINARRSHMVGLGSICKVNDYEFRSNLEDAAETMLLDSFLKLLHTYPYSRVYNSNIHDVDQLYDVDVNAGKLDEEEEEDRRYAHPLFPDEEDEDAKKHVYKLKRLYENNATFNYTGKLKDYYQIVNNLRYIVSICLPLSKTGVYRMIYKIAKQLAKMMFLPATIDDEVSGYYISGEDFIINNMTPEDDYSSFYKAQEQDANLTTLDVEKNKHHAMMLASFLLQVFSNMDDFVSCTEPKGFGDIFEPETDLKKAVLTDKRTELIDSVLETPCLIRDIENWAESLKYNDGYIKRHNITYKYGMAPKDEFMGDDPEEVKRRKIYEIEKLRDEFLSLFVKRDRIDELISGISKVFFVSEEFMLKNMPNYWLNFLANMIYNDLKEPSGDFGFYVKAFNMSESAVEQVKYRIMQIHMQALNGKYGLTLNLDNKDKKNVDDVIQLDTNIAFNSSMNPQPDSGPYKGDEFLNSAFNSLKDVGNKIELAEEKLLNHYRVFTFHHLIDELRSLDLDKITKDDVELIKSKYKSSDIVFVNAFCQVIMETVVQIKRNLHEAVLRRDYYIVESRVDKLIRIYKAVTNSLQGLIDPKYNYRIAKAIRYNLNVKRHHFELNEIVGTDHYSPTKRLMWPDGTDKYVKREKYNPNRRGSDKLKEMNGDWQMIGKEDGLTPMERQALEVKREDEKMLKPLKLYGLDTESTPFQQEKRDRLVREGKLAPEMRYIPNEFHLGRRETDPEYDPKSTIKEDKFKDLRPVILAEEIYQAWVMYTCKRRSKVNQNEFLSVFPGVKRLVETSIKDWRYLYVRLAIRNDDINSVRDWNNELGPQDCNNITENEKEEFKKVLEYCYEEELLRKTKGVMDEIEDDIGNATDFHFNAIHPSTNLRMDYIYSLQIPDDDVLEYLKKLQKFLRLSKRAIELIHSKCFHHVLRKHFKSVLDENKGETLINLETKYFRPLAQKLTISELSYKNVVARCIFEHITLVLLEITDKYSLGSEYIKKIDQFIETCKKLNVLSIRKNDQGQKVDDYNLKFSVQFSPKSKTDDIVKKYIMSHVYEEVDVDKDKLTCICNIIGYVGENRLAFLKDIGTRFYHRYMIEHHPDNIFMETFDELKSLHPIFNFGEEDFKKLIFDYRSFKVLELYNFKVGLDEFNRTLEIILDDDILNYLPIKKAMREDWLIMILNDLIRKKTFDIKDYLALSRQEYLSNLSDPLLTLRNQPNPSLSDKTNEQTGNNETDSGNQNGLIRLLDLVMNRLHIPPNELLECCFFHVYYDAEPVLSRIKEVTESPRGSTVRISNEDAKESDEKKLQVSLYDEIVDLFKILSLNPKLTVDQFKDKFRLEDTKLVRKTIIENAHSLEEQSLMLKLVDLYLE